jgi:hypothetical protein
MIDLQEDNEDILSLAEAAKSLPGRPHLSTLVRWARGMKDGRRLATVKIGGRVYTSRESLQIFATPTNGPVAANGAEMSRNRQEALARVDRQLGKEGL